MSWSAVNEVNEQCLLKQIQSAIAFTRGAHAISPPDVHLRAVY